MGIIRWESQKIKIIETTPTPPSPPKSRNSTCTSLINLGPVFQILHCQNWSFLWPSDSMFSILIFPNKHFYFSYPGLAPTVLYWKWSEQVTYLLVFNWLNQVEPHLSPRDRTAHPPVAVSIEPDALAE